MPELIWEGKYDDNGQIVGPPRVSLPFQTVETVNQSAQERQMALTAPHRGDSEWRNRLIWGDKKYVLPSLLDKFAGKVNLIYIDPPFATGANFEYQAQVHPAKTDHITGRGRNRNSNLTLEYQPNLIEQIAYRDTWGGGLDTYLKWMYETLTLLHELLSESGSIYVHCDWRTSHYTKAVMDDIFGYENFRNEIVWKRQSSNNAVTKKFGQIVDYILFYVKSPSAVWNQVYHTLSSTELKEYRKDKEGRYYKTDDLTAPGATPNRQFEWRGVRPSQSRSWAYDRGTLERMLAEGRIELARNGNAKMRGRITYLDDNPGQKAQTLWTDVHRVGNTSVERLTYPTQKPEALIERIMKASSNKDDLVLDCFIGSGTTAAVAEKLGRRWIAADMGRFAISTSRKRLLDIPDVKPFHVQNMGRYERQAWQSEDLERPYREFILQMYRANPVSGYQWLHGAKSGRLVHVGAVDSPVALGDIQNVVDEFSSVAGNGKEAPTSRGVDILSWDYGLEVDTEARRIADTAGVGVRLLRIPREVMDRKAVDAGDIRFFELAALAVETKVKRREVSLTLEDFTMPLGDVPSEVREKVTHWSQWIDYWAVDWDYHEDTFNNQWQSYRTRQESQLRLNARHEYDSGDGHTIVVKVIDILGNDTTRRLEVKT